MSHYLEPIVFKLEKKLIPSDDLTKEDLSNIPEDIKNDYINNTGGGPMGIGYDEKVGWFCLGAGQGPHLIWSEKEIDE